MGAEAAFSDDDVLLRAATSSEAETERTKRVSDKIQM